LPQIVVPLDTYPPKDLSGLPLLFIGHTSLWQCWPSAAKSSRDKMKSAVLVSVLALTAFALLEESAAARDYLHCVSKKVVIVDAPKGTTSSSTEENLGFWIDAATKIVTLADGKKLNVGRFDDRWISAVSGDVSYELDRQSGNLTYAGSTMKDGIATTIIGAGRCTVAAAPAR
jgi:hypothetical protein